MQSEQTTPGIAMQAELRLKINWKTLAENLVDVGLNGIAIVLGKVDSAISVGAGLTRMATAVGTEQDAGERAWKLFWLSFAWCLDSLRISTSLDEDALKLAIRDAIKQVREDLEDQDYLIPVSFLERPITLPLYQKMRDQFVARKSTYRFSSGELDIDLSARFDAAFSRAVSEVLMKHPDTYQALVSALSVPGLRANHFQLQWDTYRRSLIYDFEVRPMFGQEQGKIALAQAYVPLRCAWTETEILDEGVETKVTSYGMLDSILEQWLQSELTIENCVKLIGGGPGSGKSTSVKRLASNLAARPGLRPLYIPMQHISLDGNLKDSINQFFTSRTNGAFIAPPLARESIEDGPQMVIIFDGLDEIARPGDGANEIANLFVSKLEQLISVLKGDSGRCVPVIVTGRMLSFQAARRYRGASGQAALEVLGYSPQMRTYVDPEKPSGKLVRLDQRGDWWQKYATLAQLPIKVPDALSDKRLAEITNEPLLCYLLVLSGFVIDKWQDAADNRNLIYEKLINEVWQRGWGDPEKSADRQGAGRRLSKHQFNDLMETIALAAWLGGDTRVASEETFLKALKITDAEDAWKDFNLDGGEDVANLAMNFYLKASEGVKRGFEFTHKSFGDYLAARAILRLAEGVASLKPRYVESALKEWYVGSNSGVMSTEIASYMKDEMRLKSNVSADAKRSYVKTFNSLQELIRVVLLEGLPAHKEGGVNWRSISKMQRNSEVSLWCVTNAILRSVQDSSNSLKLDVGFAEDPNALMVFLVRTVIGDDAGNALRGCMSHLKAADSSVFGLNLSRFDFSYGDFSRCIFNGTHLMNANFRYSILQAARFQRANIDDCAFTGADVTGADFRDSRMSGAAFLSNTIGDVRLSARCFLDISVDENVDLERLHFDDADPESGLYTDAEKALRSPGLRRYVRGLRAKRESEYVGRSSFDFKEVDSDDL